MTAPARILVVEDEADIASVVLDYLRHAGYAAEHIADGRTALARIREAPPDLTLLDIMLPGLDGLEVLRQMRRTLHSPVIMLTARVEEVDRLIGLELGADDYICKPFSPREVVARVKAVLRRGGLLGASVQDAPALALDETLWQARLHGQPLALTRREFRLLQALTRQSGRIFSRAVARPGLRRHAGRERARHRQPHQEPAQEAQGRGRRRARLDPLGLRRGLRVRPAEGLNYSFDSCLRLLHKRWQPISLETIPRQPPASADRLRPRAAV